MLEEAAFKSVQEEEGVDKVGDNWEATAAKEYKEEDEEDGTDSENECECECHMSVKSKFHSTPTMKINWNF